jgi:heterodisulfide reductase subunit B
VAFTRRKFDAIQQETRADLIVVCCVTCLMHLDKVQTELSEGDGAYAIPVLDYSQLLALCMGFEPKEVAGIAEIPRDRIFELCAAAPGADPP